MAGEKATVDPGGQQPEMVRGLDAAARGDGVKPADQTMRAKPDTAPDAASLAQQERDAAAILKRNAEKDTGKPA